MSSRRRSRRRSRKWNRRRSSKPFKLSSSSSGDDDDDEMARASTDYHNPRISARRKRSDIITWLDGHTENYEDENEDARRVTTVKIHFCRRCGRYRSWRFHRANPVGPSGLPLLGLCSRCVSCTPSMRSPWGTTGRMIGERVVGEYRVHKREPPRLRRLRRSSPDVRIIRRRSSSPLVADRSCSRQKRRSDSSERCVKIRVNRENFGHGQGWRGMRNGWREW